MNLKFKREFWAGDEHLEVANMYREGLTEKIRGPRIEPWGSPSLGVGVGGLGEASRREEVALEVRENLGCWPVGSQVKKLFK